MLGNEASYPIWIKFCRMVDIPDEITSYANFRDDRLRGLAGWWSKFAIPIGSRRRPCNTRSTVRVSDKLV